MAIVCFVSCNGLGPTVMLGQVLFYLLKINPFNNYIFKTNNVDRYEFIKKNYCPKIKYCPAYDITKNDFVLHIINPRNIPTKGRDIFIDNIGDYWNYIYKNNIYLERLFLFKNGILESNYYFVSSLQENKTPWGQSYKKYLFVDDYIKKLQLGDNLSTEPIFFGSYKEKNKVWDTSIKEKFNFLITSDRKIVADAIRTRETIISHPGMFSISESLFLTKPYVYIHPANMEQNLNAEIITNNGLGKVITDEEIPTVDKQIVEFLEHKKIFEKNIIEFKKSNNLYNNNSLFNFLDGIINDF